jgi:hypothetical protein
MLMSTLKPLWKYHLFVRASIRRLLRYGILLFRSFKPVQLTLRILASYF